jgi:hypothetical protein
VSDTCTRVSKPARPRARSWPAPRRRSGPGGCGSPRPGRGIRRSATTARSGEVWKVLPARATPYVASLAVAPGPKVKSVQAMLGHASAAMALDVYAGLFDDDLDGVAVRMDSDGFAPIPPDVERYPRKGVCSTERSFRSGTSSPSLSSTIGPACGRIRSLSLRRSTHCRKFGLSARPFTGHRPPPSTISETCTR